MTPTLQNDSILVTHRHNLRYLTGFRGSSGCALITPRQQIFFTDSRYTLQAEHEAQGFKVLTVAGAPIASACEYIKRRRIRTGVLGYEGAHINCRELAAMRRRLRGIKLKDVSGQVERQRAVKSVRELKRIREACALADAALEHLAGMRVVGSTEAEIAWELESFMRNAGSERPPFDIIVASGPRSAMPHGFAGPRRIRSGELVVVDLGASVDGYCSDVTRTFSTGKLTARQLEIYETVRMAQSIGVAAVRAGAACSDVDAAARSHIEAAGFGAAFGHSLGHGLGLEAHEMPVLSSKSSDVLSQRMAVTVEPGIYLPRVGGVRIEDTVLVGRTAAVILTGFSRDLIELG